MLAWRLIFAAIIVIPLVSLLVVDYFWSGSTPGIFLIPIGLVAVLLATNEVLEMLRQKYRMMARWSVYLGVSAIFLGACVPQVWILLGEPYPPDCPLGRLGWPLVAMAAAIGLVFVAHISSYESGSESIMSVGLSVFVLGYVGLLSSFLALLRFFEDNQWGMAALVSMILVVKLSDTGAYAVGKAIGKHKLAPVLSPGKTVEGALGGMLAAVLAALVFFYLVLPMIVDQPGSTSAWRAVLFGLIVGGAGMVGDLSESLIKRDLKQKDSSGWLRGLGGVLDVMDSVMIAGPAAFGCWVTGLVGPPA